MLIKMIVKYLFIIRIYIYKEENEYYLGRCRYVYRKVSSYFVGVVVYLIFEPLGLDLSSQAGLPTFKNIDVS